MNSITSSTTKLAVGAKAKGEPQCHCLIFVTPTKHRRKGNLPTRSGIIQTVPAAVALDAPRQETRACRHWRLSICPCSSGVGGVCMACNVDTAVVRSILHSTIIVDAVIIRVVRGVQVNEFHFDRSDLHDICDLRLISVNSWYQADNISNHQEFRADINTFVENARRWPCAFEVVLLE